MRFISAAAPLFELQHGVASREQLRQRGVTDHQLDHALRSGHVRSIHFGVLLQAGRPVTVDVATHAAVLAVPGSLACGWSAARLRSMRDAAYPAVPEVLTDHGDTPTVRGVRVRRTRRLHEADRDQVDLIPVTSAARTVVDLAPRLGPGSTESIVHQLLHQGQATIDDLWDAVVRLQPRPGIRSLVQILGTIGGLDRAAESGLEVTLLRCLRSLGIPGLQVQHPIELDGYGRARFDAAYPAFRVALEADHSFWHSTPARARQDARRDRAAAGAGWITLRFDESVIERDPTQVRQRTMAALIERGYESPEDVGRIVPRAS